MRFSAPATAPVAARLTAFETAGAVGTEATFESAVPRGEGDVSRSLPDRELTEFEVGIVFEGDVCRGLEETGFTGVAVAEEPFDTGLGTDCVGAEVSSDDEGVSNSVGGF